jgi:putative PIN family toxin of toxin-antitoxin system
MGTTRVIFDTNVLISALGFSGKPEQCLNLVRNGELMLFRSPETMGELARVLHYDHLPFTDDDRIDFYTVMVYNSELVYPNVDLAVSSDPDDDKFIECAVAAQADYLISGDSDLLDVGSHRNVTILSPAKFLDQQDD